MNPENPFISKQGETVFPLNLSGFGPGKEVGRGRFKLVRLLGQGGMGIVWLAEDTRLGVKVALKFLPPVISSDAAALELLRAETRRCLQLSHPNIVRIHDFHETAGEEVFFAMEYVNGPTLSALRIQQPSKVLTWPFLAPLMHQLCEALAYAHGEKVIHRDLKPSNLLIDSRGRLKLSDFGVARVAADTMTRLTGCSIAGAAGGTLAYMSPQQLEGRPPGVADDIYSVGATLYELLASRPPFVSGDIAYQVRSVRPASITERLQELGVENPVPPEVERTISDCLAKEPGQRPQSAGELPTRLGLAGVVSRQFSDAPKEGAVRTREKLRRRPAGLAAAILLIAGVAFAAWKASDPGMKQPRPGRPWANSLGMRFEPVGPVLFSIWETRVQDFEAFVRSSRDETARPMDSLGRDGWAPHGHSWKDPGYPQGPTHPVAGLRYDDAVAFCAWLTKEELTKGWLRAGQRYRLPTDDEWSQAVEEDQKQFPWGNNGVPPSGAGNYAGKEVKDDAERSLTRPVLENYSDAFPRASPVGSFRANRFGLFDLGGNLLEWCEDSYPVNAQMQVLRGGSWDSSSEEELQCSARMNIPTGHRSGQYGFRCVLEFDPMPAESSQTTNVGSLNSTDVVPFKPVFTNSLGWEFRELTGGNVLLSTVETRLQDFAAFVQSSGYTATNTDSVFHSNPWSSTGNSWRSPGFKQAPNHPVVGVNVEDALAFCRWLTDTEKASGSIGPRQRYRLPTDAEWSQAADLRQFKFPWGNSWPPPANAGNFFDQPGDTSKETAPVGTFQPSPRGFYDLGGNVAEWCRGLLGNDSAIVSRGGSWQDRHANKLQSTERSLTGFRSPTIGFRCALEGPPKSR